jgi:hypothetical protein
MQQKKRMKMCPYCEGQVEINVAICPFCGTEIGYQEEGAASSKDVRSLSPQETLASLYPPPYRSKADETLFQKEPPSFSREPPVKEGVLFEETKEKVEESASSPLFWPIFLFSLGINLLFLSFFLFFFSSEGEVQLHWKGYWWAIYFVIGLPLIIFAYKKLSQDSHSS